MLVAFVLAIIVSIIKGYNPKYILKTWTIYPCMLIELLHLYCQISVFFNSYTLVPYAMLIKKAHLFSLILPMLYFSFYKQGFIGAICILIGTILNKFVIFKNGGKMPVFPTLSYVTGYVNENSFNGIDSIHIKGSASTSYKILTDWLDIGISIYSIGDLIIMVFSFLIIYSTIVAMNKKYKI